MRGSQSSCSIVPNPLGGDLARAEGPMLDPSVQSLVGRWPMPIRHGLTIGELARHWVRTRRIDVELDVIEVTGWKRDETALGRRELTWMPPSPNLPKCSHGHAVSRHVLGGGRERVEGRSTAVPFRVIAAPYIDGERYAARIDAEVLPGVRAVPYGLTPSVRDHAEEPCEGIILDITDADAFRPVRTGVRLLSLIEELHPGCLEERPGVPMPGESDASPLERLFGVRGAFEEIRLGGVGRSCSPRRSGVGRHRRAGSAVHVTRSHAQSRCGRFGRHPGTAVGRPGSSGPAHRER